MDNAMTVITCNIQPKKGIAPNMDAVIPMMLGYFTCLLCILTISVAT